MTISYILIVVFNSLRQVDDCSPLNSVVGAAEISGDEGVRSSSEDFVDAGEAKILSKEARAFPAVVRVDLPYGIVDGGVTVPHVGI